MRLTVEIYDAGDLDDLLTIFGVDNFSYYGLKKILDLHHDMELVDMAELIDGFIEFGNDGAAWNFENGLAAMHFKDDDGVDNWIPSFGDFCSEWEHNDEEWEDMTGDEQMNIYVDTVCDWLCDEGYRVYDLENGNILVETPCDYKKEGLYYGVVN